jgi:hypothetical protein
MMLHSFNALIDYFPSSGQRASFGQHPVHVAGKSQRRAAGNLICWLFDWPNLIPVQGWQCNFAHNRITHVVFCLWKIAYY